MTGEGDTSAFLTSEHEQLQRISAIARTAASIATRASLESMLSAMADEIQKTDGIVGTQIILVTSTEKKLRMMGSAGFAQHQDFFDTLVACRDNGAPLATYAALESGRQRVYPNRKTDMLDDHRWSPMHAYISELDWKDFIATPFGSPQGVRGVIHCYIAPDVQVTPPLGRFLEAMAEQAALAVDYHDLIERDRMQVRRDERERIARDLHDAVIQNMFAININANVLESMARAQGTPAEAASKARDIQQLAMTVQQDLRGIIRALRPSVVAEQGLEEALESFAAATSTRFGIRLDLSLDIAGTVDSPMADDCYYVVVEAVHNAVKHARASSITISVISHSSGALSAEISDDGVGMHKGGQAEAGYGIASMRHRVSQWSGTISITPRVPSGTTVEALFMAPVPPQLRRAR